MSIREPLVRRGGIADWMEQVEAKIRKLQQMNSALQRNVDVGTRTRRAQGAPKAGRNNEAGDQRHPGAHEGHQGQRPHNRAEELDEAPRGRHAEGNRALKDHQQGVHDAQLRVQGGKEPYVEGAELG